MTAVKLCKPDREKHEIAKTALAALVGLSVTIVSGWSISNLYHQQWLQLRGTVYSRSSGGVEISPSPATDAGAIVAVETPISSLVPTASASAAFFNGLIQAILEATGEAVASMEAIINE